MTTFPVLSSYSPCVKFLLLRSNWVYTHSIEHTEVILKTSELETLFWGKHGYCSAQKSRPQVRSPCLLNHHFLVLSTDYLMPWKLVLLSEQEKGQESRESQSSFVIWFWNCSPNTIFHILLTAGNAQISHS